MLSYEGKYANNLNFGSAVSMEIENGIFSGGVFLAKNDGTDVFAVIIGNVEIDAFNCMTFNYGFSGADGIDIVGVLVGSDNTSPGPFKGLFEFVHE